jgi:uncharacterized SAM-binding protein YcdF (DUF218 family)
LTGAGFFWFLFSSGGVLVTLLAGVVWLFAKPTARAPRLFLAFIGFGYTAASIYSVPHLVERWIGSPFHPLTQADVPAGRNVVVLLGSGSYRREDWSGESLSILDPIGAERTLEAARVYRLVKADYVISSGGVVGSEQFEGPSGVTMQNALVQLGVPPDRIIVERESTNTRTEAIRIKAMLPSLGADHLILVTSAIHMRRAAGMFRAAGIDVIPAIAHEPEAFDPTDYFLPTHEGLRTSALAVHELVGISYYWLRGWYKSR